MLDMTDRGLRLVKNSSLNAWLKLGAPSLIKTFGRLPVIDLAFLNIGVCLPIFRISDLLRNPVTGLVIHNRI